MKSIRSYIGHPIRFIPICLFLGAKALKRSFMILVIFGILLIFFGIGFALQGDGILPGSMMSGVTFWIYAGSVIALFGFVLAVLGFMMGSKKGEPKTGVEDKQDASARSDPTTR